MPPAESASDVDTGPHPAIGEASTEPRMVAVPLSPGVYEALEAIARRNGVSPSQVVSELLESWLRYR
jgi:hypothetical protein